MFPIGTLSQQGGGSPTLLSGLVSWFTMGEPDGVHKVDVHGSNTTNISQFISNITRVIGKQGRGTNFGGGSVHCQPPTGIPSGLNDWSVAFWVNLNELTTDTMDHLLSITDNNVSSNAADGWHISYRAGTEDAFDVTVRVGATRYHANASTFGTPSPGVWYFLYAYYDATAGECGISINNGTIDTATVTGTPNTKTVSFNIGRWGYTGGFPFYLNGQLDEIGVWDRTLTAAELTWLYNAGLGRSYHDISAPPENILVDLISWWALDEDSGTRSDSHGSNNLSDNATVTAVAGKISQAAEFVAANSEYLDIASSPFDFNSDWTISGWFNLTTTGLSDYPCLLASATGASAAQLEMLLEFDDASDDKLRLYIGESTAYKNVAWTNALSASTWYHFIIYYDVSATTIGISVDNGTAVENNTTTINSLTSPFFRMGRWSTGANRYFNGLIDEVAIWNRLLTAEEKAWLYNSGNSRSYPDLRTGLTIGLVSWWDFDDATDAHGTNDWTASGTVNYISGLVGNCADTAASGELTIADAPELCGSDRDFSIAGWVQFDSLSGTPVIFCSNESTVVSNNSWVLQYDGTYFKFQIANSSTWYICQATTFGTPSTATWYFIYAYYDSVNDQLGISINDGTVDTLGSVPAPNYASHFRSTILGYGGSGSYGTDGRVDSWGFWDRLLSADEIAWLYNSGVGKTYGDL